jgi:hypothetical protein
VREYECAGAPGKRQHARQHAGDREGALSKMAQKRTPRGSRRQPLGSLVHSVKHHGSPFEAIGMESECATQMHVLLKIWPPQFQTHPEQLTETILQPHLGGPHMPIRPGLMGEEGQHTLRPIPALARP